MYKNVSRLFIAISLLLIGACATLNPDFDPPRVSMESLKVLPSESAVPRFEIKLRVANPNSTALDIAGVSYSLELLDRELLHGVTSDVPQIAGYSDELITLEASVQMFQVLRMLAGLTSTAASEQLAYRFSAKIDFNGFTPTQRIEEVGEISLNPE